MRAAATPSAPRADVKVLSTRRRSGARPTSIAWIRKVKLRGLPKVDWLFVFASAAFNLIRLPKLLARPA
jgi:hypothetical protein